MGKKVHPELLFSHTRDLPNPYPIALAPAGFLGGPEASGVHMRIHHQPIHAHPQSQPGEGLHLNILYYFPNHFDRKFTPPGPSGGLLLCLLPTITPVQNLFRCRHVFCLYCPTLLAANPSRCPRGFFAFVLKFDPKDQETWTSNDSGPLHPERNTMMEVFKAFGLGEDTREFMGYID